MTRNNSNFLRKVWCVGAAVASIFAILVGLWLLFTWQGEGLAKFFLKAVDVAELDDRRAATLASEMYSLAKTIVGICGVAAMVWVVTSLLRKPGDPVTAGRSWLWFGLLATAAIATAPVVYNDVFLKGLLYSEARRPAFGAFVACLGLAVFWLASVLGTWRPIRPAVPLSGWYKL